MRVTLAGTGDAFGTAGRFHACFHLQTTAGPILLDCGASSLIALKRAGLDPQGPAVVLVSHLHGDHFGGLAFLLREAVFKERTRPLAIAGPRGAERRIATATEALFPDTMGRVPFELTYHEWVDRKPETLAGATCTPFEISHPSGAPAYALRVEVDGRIVAYSGDMAWSPTLQEAARGADLLLCEAYTWARPLRSHLDHETLRRNPLGAKRIVLVHQGPEVRPRASELAFESGDDGLVIDL